MSAPDARSLLTLGLRTAAAVLTVLVLVYNGVRLQNFRLDAQDALVERYATEHHLTGHEQADLQRQVGDHQPPPDFAVYLRDHGMERHEARDLMVMVLLTACVGVALLTRRAQVVYLGPVLGLATVIVMAQGLPDHQRANEIIGGALACCLGFWTYVLPLVLLVPYLAPPRGKEVPSLQETLASIIPLAVFPPWGLVLLVRGLLPQDGLVRFGGGPPHKISALAMTGCFSGVALVEGLLLAKLLLWTLQIADRAPAEVTATVLFWTCGISLALVPWWSYRRRGARTEVAAVAVPSGPSWWAAQLHPDHDLQGRLAGVGATLLVGLAAWGYVQSPQFVTISGGDGPTRQGTVLAWTAVPWASRILLGVVAMAFLSAFTSLVLQSWTRFRHRHRGLQLDTPILTRGRRHRALLTIGHPGREDRTLHLTLQCRVRDTVGDSSEGAIEELVVRWQHHWTVPANQGRPSSTGWQIHVELPVPADLPATNDYPQGMWSLLVQSSALAGPPDGEVRLPVGDIDPRDHALVMADLQEDLSSDEIPLRLRATGRAVGPLPGGLAWVAARTSSTGAGKVVTVTLAILVAWGLVLTGVVQVVEGRTNFFGPISGLVVGILALLLLLVVVLRANRTRLYLSEDGLTRLQWSLRGRTVLQVRRQDLTEVAVTRSYALAELEVRTADGPVPFTTGTMSPPEAEHLAEALRRYWRLPTPTP